MIEFPDQKSAYNWSYVQGYEKAKNASGKSTTAKFLL